MKLRAEIDDELEKSIAPIFQKNQSWCLIVPYLQQSEVEESIGLLPRESESGWWIGPTSGIIWGMAREIVFHSKIFRKDAQNENDYLSELKWELNQAFVVGVESFWRGKKSDGLKIKFSFAIPNIPVGKMDDYDWYYKDRDWSHWSQSSIKLRWGFIFDFLYEEVLVRSNHFKLKVGAGYHMDWWAWKDKGEDSLYSTTGGGKDRQFPDKFSPEKGDKFRDRPGIVSVGENGINYWAMYHVPLVSLRGNFEWDYIFFSILARIGPILGIAKDHHLLRYEYGPNGVYFYDLGLGGPWIDTSLEVGLKITDRLLFLLQGEFAWLFETRAISISVGTKEKREVSVGSGGLAFKRIGANLLVLWKI